MITKHEFNDSGNVVRYTRCGSGPTVILVHNGGASKEIWTAQVGDLCPDHEVINLDLLGFGESDLPDSGFLITDYVNTLERFLEHLDRGPVAVVGNCMGSAMTLLLADRRPELFRSLVLLNPLSENTARRGVIGWLMWLPAKFPRLSMTMARRVRAPHFLTPAIIAAQFGPRHWWRGVSKPTQAARISGSTWTTRGRLVAMAEMFSDVSGLRAVDELQPGAEFPPFVTVWGASNLGLSPRAGSRLNRTLKPDRAYTIDGAGHLPMLETPYEVSRIVREVIDDPGFVRMTDPPVAVASLQTVH